MFQQSMEFGLFCDAEFWPLADGNFFVCLADFQVNTRAIIALA